VTENGRRTGRDVEPTRKGTLEAGMARVYYSLYDRLLSQESLTRAFQKVKANKGKPGVDGQTVEEFSDGLCKEIAMLVRELREKSYRAQPVKRVTIAKDGGGVRELGIPTVRDRVVQQALLEILQPIFDPAFHPSSYGYRPGRSAHDAIAKAELFIRRYNLRHVVDMDLSRCFDTLDHELILSGIRKRVVDGSVLGLVRQFLQSGVMTGAGWQEAEEGSPQGGVISPLLANIYLDAFDQEMMKRGHRIVRYADDILILTRTKSAAENVLKQASHYLEEELKLTVNRQKTEVVHSHDGVKFLGVVIDTENTRIRGKRIRGLKEKVRKMTRRTSSVNLEKVIKDLNPVLRGFANYFKVTNCGEVFRKLMQWIRRRLRAKQLKLWKKPSRLHRRLRQLGYKGGFKKIEMNSWRNSASPLVNMALSNDYFRELGLFDLSRVRTATASKMRLEWA
jgi:RNA-directed DNA polymerase